MPQPTSEEKRKNQKQKFVSRCIKYVKDNENMKTDQAIAYCYRIWEESKNND